MPCQRKTLDLTELANGTPGITPDFGKMLSEAAIVCLEDQSHSSGVLMNLLGIYDNIRCLIEWNNGTDQMRRCYNDKQFATENGAYGIAILLIQEIMDLTALQRSRKGTGFDWWVGGKDQNDAPFQNSARLEVSGILNGTHSDISGRVRQKIRQTTLSDGTSLPAIIIVVEFGMPCSRVELKC